MKYAIKRLVCPYLPRYNRAKKEYLHGREIVPAFVKERLADKRADKRILIASIGSYDAKTEAIHAKALEALGYETHILSNYDPFVKKNFDIFGIKDIHFYEDYNGALPAKETMNEARDYIRHIPEEEMLKLSKDGIRIGKYAISCLLRNTRKSNLDLKNKADRNLFTKHLTRSLEAASTVGTVFKKIRPNLVMIPDSGYTPLGQIFDICLRDGIDIIQKSSSHKSGQEVLKRYTGPDRKGAHYFSLSPESWEYVKRMQWNDTLRKRLYSEIESTYRSGDWFSEVGTQFNKKIYSQEDLFFKLQLDKNKKTAVVFPHMFWDATFFWGKDLFDDYYDWFINVLKVVSKKTDLNWIIKIHPANIVKAKRDNYRGKHGELMAAREVLGQIPSHIKIIPPESDINTFSLFGIMDYCLTVRGTIGIEASALGIATLTAGTGRYDRLGFTYDFDSREDYLGAIESLNAIPPMTEKAKELAGRFAYGLFILRPIDFDLLDHGFNQDEKGSIRFRPLFKNREDFEASSFVKGFRDFVRSGKEDYLKA